MRKLTWIFVSLWITSVYAQDVPRQYRDYSVSSGFRLDSLDARNPQVVDNLATLCRIWGYAKYHHPIFADSTVNIDYELFELLPKVAHADKATRNEVLYKWVKGLGEYTPNKPMYDDALAGIRHWSTLDLGWTADTVRLGPELSALLQDIRYTERDENYYVLPAKVVEGFGWQPVSYENESVYRNITKFENGYCLLSLFRYWNIIEYFAPNMPKTEKDWDEVLMEYIPRLGVDAKNLNTFQQDYMSLIHEMSDGHAYFVIHEIYFGERCIPVWAKLIDNRLIITNPDKVNDLKPGDEILSVDGQYVGDLLKEIKKYTAYSNDAGYRQAACHYPLRSKKERAVLSYCRNGSVDSITVNTIPLTDYKWYVDPMKAEQAAFRMLNDSIGYIYAATFTDAMLDGAMEQFRNTKAIVVDLRTYPQQQWSIRALTHEYLTAKPVTAIMWSYPTLAIPGEYYIMPDTPLYPGVMKGVAPQDNPNAYNGKIIVLVDESTQSAAEGAVMCLQVCPRTLVVGSQTAGANGNMVWLPLTGGLMTGYSSIGCFYPDGYDMQRRGVKIDVEAFPTIEGVLAGRDEVLETALKYVD